MNTTVTPATSPKVTESVTPPSNDLTQAIAIKASLADGLTLAEAAASLGLSLSTAYRRLRLVEVDNDRAIAKLLQFHALRFSQDWLRASEEAAKKGDHRPAKDALIHAKAIDPVVTDGHQGTRIAIIIGTPEQPIRIGPPVVESVETGQ